ncbi:sulfotransferase family 2 domain-containing protein [Desulfobacter latus]|uniref:Sulfotransferase family 2 domain-containing protein n=1 Tax=Desulfobacter latus TaxID=2292 RepID=A0A850SYB6_9BACT|nr:sulfotransferase family 2 domain-containing protein [Desulfobacter latus]NWH03701.1 sulfotransferase family 2 domain-containing protein [Desulfobacter latus]
MNDSLFAFVHIEKAAGTTLNHILRKNFFFKFIDVRPLDKESNRVFTKEDYKKYKKINPFLQCISGHSVVPYSDIQGMPNIKFITVLRNPVNRYLSQFFYLVKTKKMVDDFEEFLKLSELNNFQTKKLAGSEDVDLAKRTLSEKMFQIGLVEEFDTFLLRFRKAVSPLKFDPVYKKKNTAKKSETKDIKTELFSKYKDQILEKNYLDIDLYEYAANSIIPRLNQKYGMEQPDNLEKFVKMNQSSRTSLKSYLDYMVRKIYYEHLTGSIRKKNGLPAKGSY